MNMQQAQIAQCAARPRGREQTALTVESLLAMPESDYMNAAQIAFFRCKLEGMLKEVADPATSDRHGAGHVEVTADPSDRATAEEEHSQALRATARDADRRANIKHSLELIKSGDYGWCADTGEPIGLHRLLAQPMATLSVDAQHRQETLKKFRN